MQSPSTAALNSVASLDAISTGCENVFPPSLDRVNRMPPRVALPVRSAYATSIFPAESTSSCGALPDPSFEMSIGEVKVCARAAPTETPAARSVAQNSTIGTQLRSATVRAARSGIGLIGNTKRRSENCSAGQETKYHESVSGDAGNASSCPRDEMSLAWAGYAYHPASPVTAP